MANNLFDMARQFMSGGSSQNAIIERALSSIPQNERQFIMQYKNNPKQGIIEGAKQGKISLDTISKLKNYANKLRLFGIKIPMNEINEAEQIIKQNQTNSNNNGGFSIF